MTEKNSRSPDPELAAFEDAASLVLLAHRRHATVLAAHDAAEAPRSRRALYAAIKHYRQSETALYRRALSEGGTRGDDGQE